MAPTDPRARRSRSLTAVPRIGGRPHSPVLSMHGLGDLFVPFSMEQAYARDVARRGRGDLLVQRAIRTASHCEFSPTEVGEAWDDLVTWVESRRPQGHGHGHHDDRVAIRPAGDDVLDRDVVKDPSYGCQFSDYSTTGTRTLFAPC